MPAMGGHLQSPQGNVLPPHSTHPLGYSGKCKAMETFGKGFAVCLLRWYGEREVSDAEIMPEK